MRTLPHNSTDPLHALDLLDDDAQPQAYRHSCRRCSYADEAGAGGDLDEAGLLAGGARPVTPARAPVLVLHLTDLGCVSASLKADVIATDGQTAVLAYRPFVDLASALAFGLAMSTTAPAPQRYAVYDRASGRCVAEFAAGEPTWLTHEAAGGAPVDLDLYQTA